MLSEKERRLLIDVPEVLRTQRLELRPPKVGDGAAQNVLVVESASELEEWMPWVRPTPAPEETEVWVRQAAAKFAAREEFHYLLRLRETGELAGTAGIIRIAWDVPRMEIGYWLRTKFWGRGLMAEAVAELTRVAFEVLGAERVEIRCEDRNVRSARVAERAGFMLEGVLRRESRGFGNELRDTRVYARLRE